MCISQQCLAYIQTVHVYSYESHEVGVFIVSGACATWSNIHYRNHYSHNSWQQLLSCSRAATVRCINSHGSLNYIHRIVLRYVKNKNELKWTSCQLNLHNGTGQNKNWENLRIKEVEKKGDERSVIFKVKQVGGQTREQQLRNEHCGGLKTWREIKSYRYARWVVLRTL